MSNIDDIDLELFGKKSHMHVDAFREHWLLAQVKYGKTEYPDRLGVEDWDEQLAMFSLFSVNADEFPTNAWRDYIKETTLPENQLKIVKHNVAMGALCEFLESDYGNKLVNYAKNKENIKTPCSLTPDELDFVENLMKIKYFLRLI